MARLTPLSSMKTKSCGAMPAICSGQAARNAITRSLLASSSLRVFFCAFGAEAQEHPPDRGCAQGKIGGEHALVMLGNGVLGVGRRHQGSELFQRGRA